MLDSSSKMKDLIKFESEDTLEMENNNNINNIEAEFKEKAIKELINMQMVIDENYYDNEEKVKNIHNNNNLDRDLILSLQRGTNISFFSNAEYNNNDTLNKKVKSDPEDESKKMPEVNLNFVNSRKNPNENNKLQDKNYQYELNKTDANLFKMKVREMRQFTEDYLESIKINFSNYIESQKNQLFSSLTTIEDLLEIEPKSPQGEETKVMTIDKKMGEFLKDLNSVMNELQKIKN